MLERLCLIFLEGLSQPMKDGQDGLGFGPETHQITVFVLQQPLAVEEKGGQQVGPQLLDLEAQLRLVIDLFQDH